MKSDSLWLLIGKKLNGEATFEELAYLEKLVNEGIIDQHSIDAVEKYWHESSSLPVVQSEEDFDKKWSKFLNEIEERNETNDHSLPVKRKLTLTQWLVAASVVIVTAITLSIYNSVDTSKQLSHVNEISAPEHGISRIKLPDGTRVWLNSESKLSYTSDFGKQIREVWLEGEAYFDVVKDKRRPFIVKTNSIHLKVLGTAFNVRSYQNEDITEASLVHGSIQVSLVKSTEKNIILKPLEKLTVNTKLLNQKGTSNIGKDGEPSITLSYIHQSVNDSIPSEALWMENKLAFESEVFSQVIERLEKWYDVEIAVRNEEIHQHRFTGRFKNESLSEALKALQMSCYFNFTIREKKVIIY